MARGGLIGALRVTLGLDSAQFEAGSKRAQAQAKGLGSSIEKTLMAPRAAVTALTGVLGTLASALALQEFVGAAKRAFDYADAIADLSDRTGASTRMIQEFRYAAQLSGSGVETADVALEKFSRTLGLAQSGSNAQIKLFRSLGVTSRDFDTAFRQTLDGLSRLPTIQQRNAASLQIFGKSAATLVGLMGQGTRGYDELARAAHNLGIVLDEDVIRNAGQANDKLDQMKMIMDAQFANAVAQNTDAIMELADAFVRLGTSVLDTLRALQNFGAEKILTSPMIARLQSLATGNSVEVERDAAQRQMLSNRPGREALWARNVEARRALARGETGQGLGVDGYGIPDNAAARAAEQRRLDAERQAILKAEVAARKAASTPSRGRPVTAGTLPTSGGGEASAAAAKANADRAAREAERATEERRRNLERYQDEMEGQAERQYGLEADLTSDVAERAALEKRRIDLAQEQYRTELERRVRDGELTQQQAERLRAGAAFNAGLERDAIDQRRDDELRRQALAQEDAALTLRADALRSELDGARTQDERRRLQLQLLDIEYDRQRAALEAVLALNSSTDAEKAIARARLAALDGLKRGEKGRVERQTMGPLGQYLDRLPRDAAELNEAYQQVAADGLQSLNDGLVDAIMNSRSLGDVFGSVANQIVADLIRIAVQKSITGPIGSALGSILGGGGDLTSLLGQGNGITSADAIALPGLAGGGTIDIFGNRGVDQNTLSLNGSPIARVNYGERIAVTPANDRGGPGGAVVHQTIQYSGAVDVADKAFVLRMAAAAKQAAEDGVREANRRRG